MTAIPLLKNKKTVPANVALGVDRLNNWQNEQSGFGVNDRLSLTNFYNNTFISSQEAEALYRTDWAAGKAIDIPIGDMFKKDIDFVEDESESTNIEPLQEEMQRLNWRQLFW